MQARTDEAARLLMTIPGIGPLNATALVAAIGKAETFGRGRDLAAWLGLVPKQMTTGGKPKLLGISKRGDKHLRQLLVQCSRVYMQRLDHQKGALADWVKTLLSRRHSNVVACALANKLARIAWAIATHHTQYEAGPDALNA